MSTDSLSPTSDTCEVSRRTATVNYAPDGELLGISLCLGAEELAQLGISSDTISVAYWIEDGELRFASAEEVGFDD